MLQLIFNILVIIYLGISTNNVYTQYSTMITETNEMQNLKKLMFIVLCINSFLITSGILLILLKYFS